MRSSQFGRFIGLIALVALFSTFLPPTANAAVLQVTSAADSGPGTLRQALSTAGPGTVIIFDPVVFPPNNPTIIAVTSPLPSWPSANIVLDASNAGVILDGFRAPVGTNGLILERSSCTVLGLTVRNFPGNGIFIAAGANSSTIGGNRKVGAGPNGQGNAIILNGGDGLKVQGNGARIWGNTIGTDAAGVANLGNRANGVTLLLGASNNSVGDPSGDLANIISGNAQNGVWIGGVGTIGNLVTGNIIGARGDGLGPLGNGQSGVSLLNGAQNNQIGGSLPGEGNLIGGNGDHGVNIAGAGTSGNQVRGNWIGISRDGIATIPNGTNGVAIGISTGNTIRGNRIYANGGLGIDLGIDGVTFNHQGAIAGPNNYQNYPVLTLATSDGSSARVKGTLASTINTDFNIEFFANPVCDPTAFGEGQTFLGAFQVTTDSNGQASFDQSFPTAMVEGQGVSATATNLSSNDTSEFSYCRPVSTANINWPAATPLTLTPTGATTVGATIQQRIVDRFQEKWFKFPVQPGAKIRVKLTGLPGSAVSLHRDPNPFYNNLTNPTSASALSAEAADTAFLPSQSLPSQSLPSQSLPSQSLPAGELPTGYLPSQSLPSQSLPSQSLPSQSLPSQSLPSQSLPSQSLPSGELPSGSLPSQSLPSQSLPSQSLPSESLPAGISPEAHSGAARRSLMAVSLSPYATVQTIDRDTYDLLENLYVRVVGPYAPATPFTVEVAIEVGVCGVIQAVPAMLQPIAGAPLAPGTHKTLLLMDSSRLPGTASEVQNAQQRLLTLAGRPEVDGIVIDLGEKMPDQSPKYPRVAWANNQADQNPACPTAKNLVATEIKRIIDSYQAVNAGLDGKSTLQYIVLAGGAGVIPFFQTPDGAGLASEKDYIVPVKPSTASEAGLKSGLVQGQDGYGAQAEIMRGGHAFAVPGLAVGRLVETASDISRTVDTYIATNGLVTPKTGLITGYDFIGDAALAIKNEVEAGTNSQICGPATPQGCVSANALIQAPGLPPNAPSAWHASDLRARLFAGGHDIVVLSGHFSAGNLLAADYATTLQASEITAAPVDFTNVLVLTLGCHGGYTIPPSDQLSGASPDPDWAKAFLRKNAAGYIAATGYAYGDTEFTEYGERLFVLLAQQLRTGSGPVAIGQALVAAKQQYLAQTAQMNGIDEKTLVEMTLYGLPMMKVDMPGQRIAPPAEASIVGSTVPVVTGPGAALGLRIGQPASGPVDSIITLTPTLTAHTVPLQNLDSGSAVTTIYLSGRNGVVANALEPIFPKQTDNVSVDGVILRGVAFRGGAYTDQEGVIPLTSAPTTETSRAHPSFNSDVFYPSQVWLSNYFDAIDGGLTRLATVPAQFRSSSPGAINGTLRHFTALELQLYYLDRNWTAQDSSPAVKAAAVAAAPTILGASGVSEGSVVTFTVNVQGDTSPGIQAVWVVFTGQGGTHYHGTWQSVDLLQPNADLDPTMWQGKLPLAPGADAQDLLFMVQAVSGTGLTTLATNLGAYYRVAPASPPPAPKQTALALLSPPTTGPYLRDSSFDVLLTEVATGHPVANQRVVLTLGVQTAQVMTKADGHATITLQPGLVPGNYPVQATFQGSADYLGSSASSTFTVVKDSPTLLLSGGATLAGYPQPTSIVAVVRNSAGRPLGERSVVFIVSGSGHTLVRSVITDLWGNAPLGAVPLPAGTYAVNAYFSGVVPVPGSPLNLVDTYYNPASRITSLTLGVPYRIYLPLARKQ